MLWWKGKRKVLINKEPKISSVHAASILLAPRTERASTSHFEYFWWELENNSVRAANLPREGKLTCLVGPLIRFRGPNLRVTFGYTFDTNFGEKNQPSKSTREA